MADTVGVVNGAASLAAASSGLAALLFDVDGTLAETEHDGHLAAFNQAFEAHGLRWRWDDRLYRALLEITGGRERVAHYAREYHPGWIDQPGAETILDRVHQHKNRRFAELVAGGHIPLRPGLMRLLKEAQGAGLRLGIVTATSRGNLDALLAATMDTRQRQAFSLFVTGEDVERKKPDPECYRLALQRLALPASRVLAVEDSHAGLCAAAGAGLSTLIVRSRYFRDEDFTGAAAVADSFEEVTLRMLHRVAGPAFLAGQRLKS